MSEAAVLKQFLDLCGRASLLVAHNTEFDDLIIKAALYRFGTVDDQALYESRKMFCTMKESRDVIGLSPSGRMLRSGEAGYKNPSLQEAYNFFTGKTIKNAHRAVDDALAALEVYRGILKHT